MSIFEVISKATGEKVYSYCSDEAVEWVGWEFDTHYHVLVPDSVAETPPVQTGTTLTKLAYLRRFTAEERISIRIAAKSNPVLEDYLALLELAEEIRTDDPDTVTAVRMLEAVGLLAVGRADEVLS